MAPPTYCLIQGDNHLPGREVGESGVLHSEIKGKKVLLNVGPGSTSHTGEYDHTVAEKKIMQINTKNSGCHPLV